MGEVAADLMAHAVSGFPVSGAVVEKNDPGHHPTDMLGQFENACIVAVVVDVVGLGVVDLPAFVKVIVELAGESGRKVSVVDIVLETWDTEAVALPAP